MGGESRTRTRAIVVQVFVVSCPFNSGTAFVCNLCKSLSERDATFACVCELCVYFAMLSPFSPASGVRCRRRRRRRSNPIHTCAITHKTHNTPHIQNIAHLNALRVLLGLSSDRYRACVCDEGRGGRVSAMRNT